MDAGFEYQTIQKISLSFGSGRHFD